MTRTVSPELAAAALHGVLRHGRGPLAPSAGTVRALLAEGAPVPEGLHRELLGALYSCGPAAVLDAARRLFERPRDARLRALLCAADVADLLARASLAEPWLHAGHRTSTLLRPGRLTVEHLPYLGRRPAVAETVFVCALHAAGVGAVVDGPVRVTLLGAASTALPADAPWRPGGAPEIHGWRLEWSDRPAPTAAPTPGPRAGRALVDAARARFAREPAAAWRVAALAGELAVAPRSLQRAFARAGTSFQAELAAVRLDVAGHLIRRTRLPLAEIAAAAGFTDHPHLTRRFRAHHGCTPTEFRHRGPAAERRAPQSG
ncbi:helix-turn-helix transcriptional regulator [Kitasatospora sp. NPDC004745]|uniref:helix-turn-helix transcriptional regulator n=1 Tax=unclassified Kitasatospora TaxID=2633591 RepID=UPI0033D72B33